MKILITFLISCACTSAMADVYPSWAELESLFGKRKDSTAVEAFAATWKLKERTKGSSGAFRPKNYSYSLVYDMSKIETIILRVEPPPAGYGEEHWTEYKQDLPFGMKPTDKVEQLSKRFGKATSKRGTTWEHNGFKIWALFRKENGKLSELYISRVQKEEP